MLLWKAATALLIFVLLGLYGWLQKKMESLAKADQCSLLIQDHILRLERWELARPFIYYGYCGYARRLILEMIEAYEYLLNNGFSSDYQALADLHALLDELPPDYDPPSTGGSLFVLRVIYARIVSLNCGCSLVVKHLPSKQRSGVRFFSPAQMK